MKNKVYEVRHQKKLYALIIKKKDKFTKKGVNFVTKDSDLMQLGFLDHKKNHIINSHIHTISPRIINYCTEVLIIEKGELKIKFYDQRHKDIKKDKILSSGDIIILFKGGHGFKIMKKTQIIEVKQGPYLNKKDKKLIKK